MAKQRNDFTIRSRKLFTLYPYKAQYITNNTIPLPYIKKKDLCNDHKLSLTFAQFKTLEDAFADELMLYLRDGRSYQLPFRMGYLQFIRYQGLINRFEGIKLMKKELRYMDNWKFSLLWGRKQKNVSLKYKWLWKVYLVKEDWRKVQDYFEEDPTIILNLRQK